jgi:GT2 family glycosyltransferase
MAADAPDISVIVCAYNRREGLLRACRALLRQDLPSDRFEIIVVDNNPTDSAVAVIEALAHESPGPFHGRPVRCLAERRPGKAFAMNTGIAAAHAGVIAFTDDDCEPRPDWLRAMLADFDDPSVGVVGGPVPSHFATEAQADPEWRFLARKFLGDYSLGDRKRELRAPESPLGCNMAARATALREVGGVSPLLGPAGERWGDHEDSDLAWRIAAAGYRVVYDPAAIVDHYPDAERLSRTVIRSRAAVIGRCGYIARQRLPVSGWRKCVRTLAFSAELAPRGLRWLLCAPSSRARFVAEFRLRCALGKLAAVWAPMPRPELAGDRTRDLAGDHKP